MSEPAEPELGRNDPCHCGSGKKYKKCHLDKDQAAASKLIEKEWTKAEKDFESAKSAKEVDSGPTGGSANPNKPHDAHQRAKPTKHQPFVAPKFNMPRKSGGG